VLPDTFADELGRPDGISVTTCVTEDGGNLLTTTDGSGVTTGAGGEGDDGPLMGVLSITDGEAGDGVGVCETETLRLELSDNETMLAVGCADSLSEKDAETDCDALLSDADRLGCSESEAAITNVAEADSDGVAENDFACRLSIGEALTRSVKSKKAKKRIASIFSRQERI